MDMREVLLTEQFGIGVGYRQLLEQAKPTDQHRTPYVKRINVVGGVGKNARQNRDRFRVFGRNACAGALCSHDDKEPQLVLKQWKTHRER